MIWKKVIYRKLILTLLRVGLISKTPWTQIYRYKFYVLNLYIIWLIVDQSLHNLIFHSTKLTYRFGTKKVLPPSPNKSISRIRASQTILSLTNLEKSNNIYDINHIIKIYYMILIRCHKSWRIFLEIRSKLTKFNLRQL